MRVCSVDFDHIAHETPIALLDIEQDLRRTQTETDSELAPVLEAGD